MKFEDRARLLGLFGARLMELREARGMTRTQFARRSGIDRGNLVKYEEEGREPGLVLKEIMAKALGVSVYELLGYSFDFELEGLERK